MSSSTFNVQDRVVVQGFGEAVIIRVRTSNSGTRYDVRYDNGAIYTKIQESKLQLVGKQELKSFCRVGDVLICAQGLGIVRYVGQVEMDPEVWESPSGLGCYVDRIGIELKDSSKVAPKGIHNGTWLGKYYYTCPANTGLFIAEEDVIRLISSEEILHRCAQINTEIIDLRRKIRALKSQR